MTNEVISKKFLAVVPTSTVTIGQQEYPSGASEMVGKAIGNQLKIRREKPEQ